jgi:hypothetical protein
VKILFDQGTPAPLRRVLVGHSIETAYERGWSGLKNGELIAEAEAAGFEVFVTTDTNLRYQQNLTNRVIAVIVLMTTSWPRIQRSLKAVQVAIDGVSTGAYVEVPIE